VGLSTPTVIKQMQASTEHFWQRARGNGSGGQDPTANAGNSPVASLYGGTATDSRLRIFASTSCAACCQWWRHAWNSTGRTSPVLRRLGLVSAAGNNSWLLRAWCWAW